MTNIYVAGHNGMVGSAIVHALTKQSAKAVIIKRNHDELDLSNQAAVNDFFSSTDIDQVYLAAAHVGGIYANEQFPAEFIYRNLMIQSNVVHAAYKNGVEKLLFLGSSCIYPRIAQQPMAESELLTGSLESTNEPYAIAKIAGIKLCESYNRQFGTDFRSVMPTNLYGENDNFHAENSHVIPAMINRFHQAKETGADSVVIWGSGKPKREFLYVSDMAEACLYVMNLERERLESVTDQRLSHLNIGSGEDCTIAELAQTIAKVVGFDGELVFDTSKPDGTPRKLLNVDKLTGLGWQASTDLQTGLEKTYAWYLDNYTSLRGVA